MIYIKNKHILVNQYIHLKVRREVGAAGDELGPGHHPLLRQEPESHRHPQGALPAPQVPRAVVSFSYKCNIFITLFFHINTIFSKG